MTSKDIDLTIDEMLSDPLFLAANRVDRVDADAFERLLRETAAALPHPFAQTDRIGAPRLSEMLACLCAAKAKARANQSIGRSW